MVNLYITKKDIVEDGAVRLPENYDEKDVLLENITKVAIGYRLIWVEYTEDGEPRVRAYGRKEFKNVIIYDADNQQISLLPLYGTNFHRLDATFPIVAEPKTEEETTEETTEA